MGKAESNKDDDLQELSPEDLKHVAGGVGGADTKVKPLSTNGGGGLSDSGGDDTPGPLPGN